MHNVSLMEGRRIANNDPRLSLEERYGDHAGYVAAVKKAAANTVAQKFLLQKDADALVAVAEGSRVLRCNPGWRSPDYAALLLGYGLIGTAGVVVRKSEAPSAAWRWGT